MAIRFPDTVQAGPEINAKADRTPTVIADGQTFRVSANTQLLYTVPIDIEGDGVIQIDGALIEVD